MSKNEGKRFEENIKNSITEDMYFLRLKDSASSFGQDSSATRFSLNNPYDALIFYEDMLFALELKSTSGTSISFGDGGMIKSHQIEGLNKADKYKNICGGFLLNFRETEQTYFLPIKEFNNFVSQTTKKSINEKDIKQYDYYLVDSTKLRTNYRYNLKKLLNEIRQK